MTNGISQSPVQVQVVAPRILHLNRDGAASRIFDPKCHSIRQALAAKVLHLDHHAIERVPAPKLVHLDRHDLAPRIFHLNHRLTLVASYTETILQRTWISVRQSAGCGMPNVAHFILAKF
jgi:hypothetical protein